MSSGESSAGMQCEINAQGKIMLACKADPAVLN